jgi:hypothetical protein
MYRPEHPEYRSAPRLFNAHLGAIRRGVFKRRAADADEVAQDFLQYSLADYAKRRRQGFTRWRDVYPAYAFALASHAADWPRGTGDTEAELAAYWEQARGESRLKWDQARAVIEDAWLALDRRHAVQGHSRPL